MAGTVPILVRVDIKARVCKSENAGALRCKEKLNKSKRYDQFLRSTMGASFLDGGKLNESIRFHCAAPSGQMTRWKRSKYKRSIGSKRSNVIGSKWVFR